MATTKKPIRKPTTPRPSKVKTTVAKKPVAKKAPPKPPPSSVTIEEKEPPPLRTGREATYPYQEALDKMLTKPGKSFTLRRGRRSTMDQFVERFKAKIELDEGYELEVTTRADPGQDAIEYRDRQVEVFGKIVVKA